MIIKTRSHASLLVVCLCLFAPSFARGGDIAAAETAAMRQSLEDKAAALLAAPDGVFDPEIVDGQLIRLKIKGAADVPTSLRGSRGDRFAREKANRDAKAAFTKYLGENVVFSESDTEEIVIHVKDGQESSEVMNASAKLYDSSSAALLKGLIVLVDRLEGEGDERTCTVVLGWSKKLSDAADDARASMAKTPSENKEAAKPSAAAEPARKPAGNTKTVTRVGNVDDF